MTDFQIITIIIAILGLIGAIISVYTKSMVELAKVQIQIKNLEHEMTQKEIALDKLEQSNSTEHKEIITKLDSFIDKYYNK